MGVLVVRFQRATSQVKQRMYTRYSTGYDGIPYSTANGKQVISPIVDPVVFQSCFFGGVHGSIAARS